MNISDNWSESFIELHKNDIRIPKAYRIMWTNNPKLLDYFEIWIKEQLQR